MYVRSARAGHRVMASITGFITTRLKLKVNATKSAVAAGRERTFLGFSFTHGQRPKRRLADKTLVRFRARVRALTRRVRGVSLRQMVKELAAYMLGWRAYFGFCQTPTILRRLDKWIRRRLRAVVWKQWQRPGTVSDSCGSEASTRRMRFSRPAATVDRGGCPSRRRCAGHCPASTSTRSACPTSSRSDGSTGRTAVVRTRMPGGVGGVTSRGVPLSRSASTRGSSPHPSGGLDTVMPFIERSQAASDRNEDPTHHGQSARGQSVHRWSTIVIVTRRELQLIIPPRRVRRVSEYATVKGKAAVRRGNVRLRRTRRGAPDGCSPSASCGRSRLFRVPKRRESPLLRTSDWPSGAARFPLSACDACARARRFDGARPGQSIPDGCRAESTTPTTATSGPNDDRRKRFAIVRPGGVRQSVFKEAPGERHAVTLAGQPGGVPRQTSGCRLNASAMVNG